MDDELAYNATAPLAVEGASDGEVTAQERLVVGMVLLSFVVILVGVSSVGLWFFRMKAKKEKRGKVGGGGGTRGLNSGCDEGSSTWDALSINPLTSPGQPGPGQRPSAGSALEHGESEVMFPPLRKSQVSRRVSLGDGLASVTTPARLFGSGGGVQQPGSTQSSALASTRSLHASMLVPDISFDFAGAAGKLDVTSDNSSTRFGASDNGNTSGGGPAAAAGGGGGGGPGKVLLRPANSSPTRTCESPVPGLRLSSPPMGPPQPLQPVSPPQQQQQQQQQQPPPPSQPQPDAAPAETGEKAAALQFDAPPPRRPSKSSQSAAAASSSAASVSSSPSQPPPAQPTPAQPQPDYAATAVDATPQKQRSTGAEEDSPASPALAVTPASEPPPPGRRATLSDSEGSVNSTSSGFGGARPGASMRGRKSPRAAKRPPVPLVLFSDDGRRLSSTSQGVLTVDASAPPEVLPLEREPDQEETPQRPQPFGVGGGGSGVGGGGGELKELALLDLAAISRASSRRGSGSMSGSNATSGTPGTPGTPQY